MKRRKCILLLPTTYNDDTEVPAAVIAGLLRRIDEAFDGHTIDGICQGEYRMDDGTMVKDKSLKVWVALAPDRVDELRLLGRRFAKELKQESIYFEVTDAEVEFLRPLPED